MEQLRPSLSLCPVFCLCCRSAVKWVSLSSHEAPFVPEVGHIFEMSGVLCWCKHYGGQVTGRFQEAAFLSKQDVEVSPKGDEVPVRGQLLACRESFVWSQTGIWTCRAPVGSLEQHLLLDWVLCKGFHCQHWAFLLYCTATPSLINCYSVTWNQ